jgi:polar amino acid transport system substrate-binding protein
MQRSTMLICGGVLLAAFMLLPGGILPVTAQPPTRVVCDLWPPYQFKQDGHLSGYSTEMVREVYASMGITSETITPFPWKRALSIVETGHADALFSANYTADRLTFARYPEEPLFETPWVIWTHKHRPVTSLETLKGKRVGVVIGYSYTPEFWQFIETYCTVEKVSLDEINFRKLEVGRIDATVAEYGNGLHLMRTLNLNSVLPQPGVEIKRDGLYILFNRQSVPQSFVDEFSEKLKEFKKSARHEELRKKYFGPAPR